MSEVKKTEPKSECQPELDKAKKTILIVEDDGTHRALMDKILKLCDFHTVQAENGVVALSKIDSGQPFDLVLMDWDMPELNGLETVKAIRAREVKEGQGRLPVMAFTANRSPGDREKCIAAGMDAYLPKDVWMPKWRDTLIDNLQGLIAGNFDLVDLEEAPAAQRQQNESFKVDTFDMQILEQTAALLKDELAIAVEEYLEDAASYIRDIREGLEASDADKAARGSHPLKSNSKSFGLTSVSQISEAINAQARAGDMETVKTLLPQLQQAFDIAERKLVGVIKREGR